MARNSTRLTRLSDQIQRDLASMLDAQVKDPRIGMITVTGVELSNDHRHAKVYFSSLGDASGVASILDGLTHASGFLRSRLAKGLRMRVVPELHFVHDQSVADGMRLSALIDAAVSPPVETTPDDDHS